LHSRENLEDGITGLSKEHLENNWRPEYGSHSFG